MTGGDLFDAAALDQDAPHPLADRMRPTRLGDVVGQDHLLGSGAPIRRMLDAGRLSSLILWGPPGVGKTTIARLLAKESGLAFEQISAIFTGVADLRKVFQQAEGRRAVGQVTLLFVDEIHRFNKAQQDSFLPHVESGLITLIGATTENPSFELNSALLSRAQVLTLKHLDEAAMAQLLARAETLEGRALPLTDDARAALIALANGDGRYLLNLAEEVFLAPADEKAFDRAALEELVQQRAPIHDKSGDGHYNLASVLQKSIRGSDTDAALYWAARMLVAGEHPRFIFRRLIVIASEDVGNADPHALPLAIAARDAFEHLGQPEGEIALGQLVAYLASAPKSNRAYAAFKNAKDLARKTGSHNPPMHALNAPTQLMKEQGYSKGYIYDHNLEEGSAGLNYFPDGLEREVFYKPSSSGAEKEIAKRLEKWAQIRKAAMDDD